MSKEFSIEKKQLRKIYLEKIYAHEHVNHAILNVLDIDIYSKDKSLFSNLTRSVRQSLLDDNITLTTEQFKCLDILSGSNLFLSAPTSFGKTFVGLEYIARNVNSLNNIVFVVPTISLMNELRSKCYKYFGTHFTLITSTSELELGMHSHKKIIIIVPERINSELFQSYFACNPIDFLMYDEIYKLNYSEQERNDNSRIIKMNYIYKFLIDHSRKILLLGPFIRDVSFNKSNLKIEKFVTNLNLIRNEFVLGEDYDSFFTNEGDKKFIFFKSPASIVKFLGDKQYPMNKVSIDETVIEWISKNIHPDWYYIEYLKHGVGIHHGKTPLFLRKYIEDEYCNGSIHTILCTSTLIEGINTPTNTLVIYDKPRDSFQLSNLIGRVGRLNVDSPQTGKIIMLSKEIMEMIDEDNWIDLQILYECDDILTTSLEDESLYLDKIDILNEMHEDKSKEIDNLKKSLLDNYNIEYTTVLTQGIEFKFLKSFIDNFNSITTQPTESETLNIIIKYLFKQDFYKIKDRTAEDYSDNINDSFLGVNTLYRMLMFSGNKKKIINEFTSNHKNFIYDDINKYIDLLFAFDEFIKFHLAKVVDIFDLFRESEKFNNNENFSFVQLVHRIVKYCDSKDGYYKVLIDLGFPQEDISFVCNDISKYSKMKSTEAKLKEFKKTKNYNSLSPFGKKIIEKIP